MQIELLPALASPQGDGLWNIRWSRMNPADRRLIRTWVRRMGSPFFISDMGRNEDQWIARMGGKAVCCLYTNPHDEESCGFPIEEGDINLFLIIGISKSCEELCGEDVAWKSAVCQSFLNPDCGAPGLDTKVRRLVTESPVADIKRRNALLEAGFRPIAQDRVDATRIWYLYNGIRQTR